MSTDPASPEVVASRLNEHEAAAVINHLATVGIEGHVWNSVLTSIAGESATFDIVQVVVKQVDAERARTALADFQKETSDVNWDEVDVGEPEDE